MAPEPTLRKRGRLELTAFAPPAVVELEDTPDGYVVSTEDHGVPFRFRIDKERPSGPTPEDVWLQDRYGQLRGEYFWWDPSLSPEEMMRRWRDHGAKGYDSDPYSFQLPTGESFQAIFPWRKLWPYRRDDRPLSEPLVAGLREHGWLSPVMLRIGRNGCIEIGEGNHRIRAAKDLDLQYVPVSLWFVQEAPCVSDRDRRERARGYGETEAESRQAAIPEHIGFYKRRPMKFNAGRGDVAVEDPVVSDVVSVGRARWEMVRNGSCVSAVFDEAFDEVAEQFPDVGTIELHEDEAAGADNGAGSERQFAYCKDGDPIVVAFAPKAERLPESHLRGLMRHEFGHALEYRYGVAALQRHFGVSLPSKVERRADVIAELVWGQPVQYDGANVQCVGVAGAKSRRPSHLPDEKAVLRPNPTPNATGDVVTLPAGSPLFHGSIEPIEGPLRVGPDGVLWFADVPAIAQLYIPCSGITMHAPVDIFRLPSKDPSVQAVQRFLGIDYDLLQVRWDRSGWRADSFYPPDGWDRIPRAADIVDRFRERQISVDGDGLHARVELKLDGERVMGPDECSEGTLFVARPRRDMRIYVLSHGEGDLMSPQYREYEHFADLAREGYDGVLIDDFAQSKEWGNLGHMSLGLFREATKDLDVTSRFAQYREFEMQHWGTPEYPAASPPYFARLGGVVRNAIRSAPPGFLEGSVIKQSLYHGSAVGGLAELKPHLGAEYGIYLTPQPRYARQYGPHLYEVFASVERPLVVEGKHEISPADLSSADVRRLMASGYDAIVSTPTGRLEDASEVVVFESSNVHILDER